MSVQLLSKVWNYKKVNSEGEGGFGQGREVVIHAIKNNIHLFLFLYFYSQVVSVNVLCVFTLKINW